MRSFNSFRVESKLSSVVNNIIRKLISTLNFGKQKKIKISMRINEDAGGLQAQYGYFSEFVTATSLAQHLYENNHDVVFRGKHGTNAVSSLLEYQKKYENYIRKVDDSKKVEEKLTIQKVRGSKMGSEIYKDAIHSSVDIPFLEFDVLLTGESGKGITKADVELVIKKQGDKEAIDTIYASLKSYKSWSINLANTTLVSFINRMKMKVSDWDMETIKTGQNIRQDITSIFLNDKIINKKKAISKKYSNAVWNAVKGWKPVSTRKEITREHKNMLQQAYLKHSVDFLPYFVDVLNKAYKKDRRNINDNFLDLMGFDGADDVYMAVGTIKNVQVVSSRNSAEFKKLLDDMIGNKNLNIEFIHKKGNTSSIMVKVTDGFGNLIIAGTWSIGKTGSLGQAKINAFMDFKFLKK